MAITEPSPSRGALDFTDDSLIASGSADAKITYKLASLPVGTLKLNGVTLGVGDTFTQADIDDINDKVTYTAPSTAGSTSFTFTVLDEAGNETSVASTFTSRLMDYSTSSRMLP